MPRVIMKKVQKNTVRTIALTFAVFVCAILFLICFLSSQKWVLPFRGLQEMFLLDWEYVNGILMHPGGLTELAAKFLVQFFTIPGAGVVVTIIILGLNALLVWKIMERTACTGGRFSDVPADGSNRNIWGIFPLCLLPSAFLAVSLLDYYSFYQGLLAYVAAVFCLWEYTKIRSCRVPWVQGCLMTVGLFFLAGSVALLFAVRALLFDIFVKRPKSLLSIVYPLLTIVLGLFMIQTGEIASVIDAFTPKMYYEVNIMNMPEIHYVSWVMLSVCIFIAACSRRLEVGTMAAKGFIFLLCAAATLGTYAYFGGASRSEARTRLYRLECLATNEDWDGIIRLHGRDVRSQNEANYLNLALAEKGILSEDLFKYRQNGPASLINDVKAQNEMDLPRLGRILFAMGNMGAAQGMAFNANQAFGDNVPSMLGMILQIDLMRGSYLTAEKYIRLMEKSVLHSKWASSQRVFLGNDEMVENESVLGNGRRDLGCEDAFVLYTNPMDDLFRIVEANPSDEKAMEYALSYLLLAKDMDNVVGFVEKYFGAPALRTLPTPVQECLLFYSDYYGTMDVKFAVSHGMPQEDVERRQAYDIDWILAHGVTEENLARFKSFKEKYGKAAQSRNPKSAMASFRETFWYYLLFTQISDN